MKLTEEQISQARHLYHDTSMSVSAIARRYDVSPGTLNSYLFKPPHPRKPKAPRGVYGILREKLSSGRPRSEGTVFRSSPGLREKLRAQGFTRWQAEAFLAVLASIDEAKSSPTEVEDVLETTKELIENGGLRPRS